MYSCNSVQVLLDKAHKSIKDRVWDVASRSCVSSLPKLEGEDIGFVRFSRHYCKGLLYVAVETRDGLCVWI